MLESWLHFCATPGIGPAACVKMAAKIMQSAAVLPPVTIPSAVKQAIDQALAWEAQSQWHHILPLYDTRYPQRLKEIADPPPLLYVLGNLDCLNHPQVAVVGSRHFTPYGRQNTETFTTQLAEQGLTITSGLALGIDQFAHKAALTAKGYTIAVLGSGLLQIYPRQHMALAQTIVEQGGAVISEFPLTEGPNRFNFPKRNRIISGLSLGTLVIEATEKSGSLITARLALEQNREVFTIPGSILSPQARGCHSLIQQGAKCVTCVEDILEELPRACPTVKKATKISLPPEQQVLLDCIEARATPMESILQKSGLSVSVASSMLLILEMSGQIVSIPGGYQRV